MHKKTMGVSSQDQARVSPSAGKPSWLWVLTAVLIWFLINGIAYSDYREFSAIIADWQTVSLPMEKQFVYSSPFFFTAGKLFAPLGSAMAYSLVTAGGLAFLSLALYRYISENFSPENRPLAIILLMWSPLLMVIMQWLGKGDSYLLAFFLLLMTPRPRWQQFALGCLMLLCHRELTLSMLALHCIVRRELKVWPVLGAMLGITLIYVYHHLILNQPPSGRINFVMAEKWAIPEGNLRMLPAMILLSLGAFWLYLLAFARLTKIEAALLIGCYAIAVVTLDFTRVFTLLSMPLLLPLLKRGFPAAQSWLSQKGWWIAALIAVLPGFQLINFNVVGSRTADNMHMLAEFANKHR